MYHIINVNDIESARDTYPTSLNQIPKTLEPVSTIGSVSNGLMNIFYGKVLYLHRLDTSF